MIRAYIGLAGTGKTLSLINDGIKLVREGRRVITNVPFVNRKTGFFDKNYHKQPIVVSTSELEKLILVEDNASFLVDEGSIVFPAYYWKNVGKEFLIRLMQTRHHRLDLYYTSQGFTHTISRLRELTNEIVACQSRWFFGKHFFINTVFDPNKYRPDFETEYQEKRAMVSQSRIYWKRAQYLFKCYDTYRDVRASSLMGIDNEARPERREYYSEFSPIPSSNSITTLQ